MKRIFCLLAVLFCTFLLLDVSAQGEYATPKSGEGISSFLERNKRPGKAYYNEFMKLNEKRLRGKEELRLGVKYVLPPLKKGTSASVSPKAVAGKKRVVRERLFGKKLADVPVTSNRMAVPIPELSEKLERWNCTKMNMPMMLPCALPVT